MPGGIKKIKMSQKNNNFTIKLIKKNGKLVHQTNAAFGLFMDFVDTMEEGQTVEAFFDAYKDDGTNVQLAKIHATLKQLAADTGNSVNDLKLEIKRRTGNVYTLDNGELYIKSFADCSKEELGLVIEELKSIAFEMANIVID
jgi:hypothetical protein